MKTLIVGGLHGDEPTGINVIKQIGGLLANPEAAKVKKRFVETDLNRSFGVKNPISLEEKRAVKLGPTIKKYDLVIDIHNTKALNCNCAIVVIEPTSMQKKLTGYFGFKRLVIMPPSGSLLSMNPNKSISLEYSLSGSGDNFTQELIDKIKVLKVTNLSDNPLKIYKYTGKVLSLTLKRLKIDKHRLNNFEKLPNDVKNKLGLTKKTQYCPFFLKKDKSEEVAFTLLEVV